MSNAFDGAAGQRASDTVERTSVDTGVGARAVSVEDGLLGLEPDADADVRRSVSGIAGIGGIVATAVVALGAWSSLGGPTSPTGWVALGLGLAVAAAFGRRTCRSLASGEPR